MSRYHLTCTSRALSRVFVAPNLAPRLQIPLEYAPTLSRHVPLLPVTSVRTKIGGPRNKPAPRQALSDVYTCDGDIQANEINLIDERGNFVRNVYYDDAMRKFNRVTHSLLLLSKGRTNESGEQDPDHLPTCKIISKIDLRNQYHKKIAIEKKLQNGPSNKMLELNWAIAGGDLKHRLEKLKGFLREGRKVEILLCPKRRGKKATEAEARNVLQAVTDAVDECRGAREIKREGDVGLTLVMFVQGTKLEDETSKEKKGVEE